VESSISYVRGFKQLLFLKQTVNCFLNSFPLRQSAWLSHVKFTDPAPGSRIAIIFRSMPKKKRKKKKKKEGIGVVKRVLS
jgi:hypothetical protein